MKSLEPGKIIKSQADKNKTITLISLLLMKVATLYQIPNWGEGQSVVLADWICLAYRFELLDVVIRTLNNPPIGDDKNWRLTPDTIQAWMSAELEREAIKREKEIQNTKQEVPLNDLDILLQEALNENDNPEAESNIFHHRRTRSKMVPLTEDEIEKEGQEKPFVKPYSTEHLAEVKALADKKIEYGRLHTDLWTGEKKPNSPSFDEWIKNEYDI